MISVLLHGYNSYCTHLVGIRRGGGGRMTKFSFFTIFYASGHRIHHIIIGKGYGGLPWPQTKEKKVAKQKKS